jgi:transposase-like protein
MTRSSTGKTVEERTAYWRERIAEQERSGIPVQQFCKERGITEQSFYVWRKRLRKQEPARFALVETGPARQHAPKTGLELVLVTGERLHIGADVDPSLLRRVLEAVRG